MMRKSKKILCVITLVLVSLSQSAIESSAGIDISAGNDYSSHWAAIPIEKMLNDGKIQGYPDGSFKPENPITRAEFITILDKIMGYTEFGEVSFKDVTTNDWFYASITKAGTAGIAQGDNGLFRPNDRISRQEAAVVLFNAYKLTGTSLISNKFTDESQIAPWALNQISVLSNLGFINGRTSTEFAPKADLTRAEAVKLIDNISSTQNTATEIISSPGTTTSNQGNSGTTNDSQENVVISVTIKELQPSVITVGTGVYNLIIKNEDILTKFPSAKSTSKFNLFIKGSADIEYEVIYVGNIPLINGPGWLAFNIQGASEQQILDGTITNLK